jgi:hypothetical protein
LAGPKDTEPIRVAKTGSQLKAFGAAATYPLWLVVYCIFNLFVFQAFRISNSIGNVLCDKPDIVKVHQQLFFGSFEEIYDNFGEGTCSAYRRKELEQGGHSHKVGRRLKPTLTLTFCLPVGEHRQ